ncbi:prephenate dehydrogenase [Novipirellula artificiosorum]|uniref:Prephenate dehydrogenase n=1 Tax=Novipirellula artificiosorum TaxID=2528016 RepID=A0A5C6DF81_9BACT|nr:prephenate dehydrogenase [Novipirellula artificiosorum]TWU34401.1 prephenate dehydrogenase [Novipirellula artificiosorum]
MNDWPRRIAIVGVGLLGASVAKSVRATIKDLHVTGVVRDPGKRESLLLNHVIDSGTDSIETASRDADVVVVATPVNHIADFSLRASAASPADCLITDVGSTKQGIVDAVAKDHDAIQKFVAAHPIAGSEKTGADYACADLFRGKMTVLTPHPQTSVEQLKRAERFWQLTGSRTVTMTPAEHDDHLAAVSHVPHLASSAVANLVAADSANLVGSGWLDITRVAAGDPGMWLAICQENRQAIRRQLAQLAGSIDDLQQMLKDSDDVGLLRWLQQAKSIRDQAR